MSVGELEIFRRDFERETSHFVEAMIGGVNEIDLEQCADWRLGFCAICVLTFWNSKAFFLVNYFHCKI